MGLGGGDRLARGAKSAQFSVGGAKKGSKVVINPGMAGTDAEATAAEKEKVRLSVTPETPRIKSKLTPLYDRVIIRKTEELDRIGSIIIPDEAKDRPSEGTVLYVGFGRLVNGELKPLWLKGGEKVLFGKYSGTEVKVDGETVLLMREDEILAAIG